MPPTGRWRAGYVASQGRRRMSATAAVMRVILSGAGRAGRSWWSWCRLAEPPCRVPRGTACPGCRLHEVHLGVIWLVVDELITGGAVPAEVDGSAAGEVTRGVGLVAVPLPQWASRWRAPASSVPSAVSW